MGETPNKKPSRQPHQKGKSVYFNINLADERYIWEYFQNSSLKFSDVAKRLILEKLLKGESLESYDFPISNGGQPNVSNSVPAASFTQVVQEQVKPAPVPTPVVNDLPQEEPTVNQNDDNNNDKITVKVGGRELEQKEESNEIQSPTMGRGRGSARQFGSAYARASDIDNKNKES